jgi:hypothetical protein
MERLQQVTFRFEHDYEVRYPSTLPEPGDVVRHGDELWVATSVDCDAEGVTVVCSRRRRSRTSGGAGGVTLRLR